MFKQPILLPLLLTLLLAGCGVSPTTIAPTTAKSAVQASDNEFTPVYEETLAAGQFSIKIYRNRLEQWHKTVFGNWKLDATLPLANVTSVDIKKPLLGAKRLVLHLANGAAAEFEFAQPEKVREILMGLKK
ncbi:MAG TPA: hypothetical protein V6D05_18495 [Stenomitos sp.]